MANFCENCGMPLNGNTTCQNCGTKVKGTEAASAAAVQMAPAKITPAPDTEKQPEGILFTAEQKLKKLEQEILEDGTQGARIDRNRILSMISYLGILCVVPYFLSSKDEFTMFHAKQGLALFIAGAVLSLAAGILHLRWIISIGRLVLAVLGILNAYQGKKIPLPVIGKYIK